MKRLLLFALIFAAPAFAHGQIQPDPARYEASIERFENADFISPPSKKAILLVGSSSIGLWNNDAPASLARIFGCLRKK